MNMQEGTLRYGDIRGQGAARRWGRLPARSHGLTVQLSSNVLCSLLRNALALDLSEAKRTKGINSPGVLVCVPGNHQRQAPRWETRPRLQSWPLSRAARVWWDLPTPARAWSIPAHEFFSTLRAAQSQTYLVSRYLSGVLGLFLRFSPYVLELNSI